jgi:cobalt-zinc-cadmium efflux system outer membrane protein
LNDFSNLPITPPVNRWKAILSLLMLAIWLPATSHPLLESAGLIHQEHSPDSDSDHDAADGLVLLPSSVNATVVSATLVCVLPVVVFLLPEPVELRLTHRIGFGTSPPLPNIWQFFSARHFPAALPRSPLNGLRSEDCSPCCWRVSTPVSLLSKCPSFCERIMKRISLLNVCVALLVASARAAESAATTNQVSLDALVADALEHNPELNFYRAEIAAIKGERRTAGTLANPEVSATLGNKRVSGIGDGMAWSVSAQQTIEWPGRVPLRKAIANQQIKLAELGLAQFKAALAARTRALSVTLFAAQEKSAATREVADRFQSLREVLVQRDPAGLTRTLETRIIEATELTLHRRASEAATAEQAALLELNQLRGQLLTETMKVQRPALSLPPAPNMERLLAAAFTNNFELQMRRAELEQQGFKVPLAKNDRNPSFSVGPYVSQERTGDNETQIGIGVTVPLPLWNRNKGSIETAEGAVNSRQPLRCSSRSGKSSADRGEGDALSGEARGNGQVAS